MKRTRQESLRLTILFCLIAAFFLLVTARLVQLQIINGEAYGEQVEDQSEGTVSIPAARGNIYDRYGRVVARDVIGSALYAYPSDSHELGAVAKYLKRLYGRKSRTANGKYDLEVRKFKYIDRRVSDEEAYHISKTAPRGLYLRNESRREYSFGKVGRQVIGFTNIDNKGQSGFELSHDSILAGQPGVADFQRDGKGTTFRIAESAMVQPRQGTSVVLTIDWRLQDILEQELAEATAEFNAKSGMAVMMNVHTGEILAMGHYDPDESNSDRPSKCRAVTDLFEPGSVLKAFTAAGLLDAGIIEFDDTIFCEDGRWKVGNRYLHDDKERGWLNFREIMEISSNIGIGKLAVEYGGDNLYEAFVRFGFDRKTNCGLPGEPSGMLRPLRWSDYNVAALAMGHSIAVTPVQIASAMAAIANGGELIQPSLVLGAVDDKGFVRPFGERPERTRVIQQSSIDTLQSVLRGVVERGTATPVSSPTVAICGKTGTAEIPDPETGRYLKNRFMASFAGFFPYESPIIAGIVVLKDPRPITYGGYTAGVAFRRIAERYAVSNPDLFAVPEQTLVASNRRLDNTVETPDFIGRDIQLAIDMAARQGITLHSSAIEGVVEWQYPPPDRLLLAGDEVVVKVRPSESDGPIMADLLGMSVRQVSALLHAEGIRFAIEGNGRVVKQSIQPGETISKQSVCRLSCRPG
jgi:cell division protein FtsI (penicillin-binding protein 3)